MEKLNMYIDPGSQIVSDPADLQQYKWRANHTSTEHWENKELWTKKSIFLEVKW
jgi:hypothetical protein